MCCTRQRSNDDDVCSSIISTSSIISHVLINCRSRSYFFYSPIHLHSSTDQMPKSFSYSFDATSLGVSSSVKIDILEPPVSSLAIQSNVASSTTTSTEMLRVAPSTPSSSSSTSSKYGNLSSLDELNLLSHEIDKQITKKTNDVLELAKEFLAGTLDSSEFHTKMLETGNIAMADLTLISKKLIKRHKFEANPNQRDFMRVKRLQFPTDSKDLGEFFCSGKYFADNELFGVFPGLSEKYVQTHVQNEGCEVLKIFWNIF
jgi:hypothetical protein